MDKESQEAILFEIALKRLNKMLRLVGLSLDEHDMERSWPQKLRNRIFLCLNCIWLHNAVIMQVAWLIDSLLIGRSFTEITYFLPCLTMCLLGDFKAFFFTLHTNEVNDVIKTLRKLQVLSKQSRSFRDEVEEEMTKKHVPICDYATYSVWCSNSIGLMTFAVGPLVLTAYNYMHTGVLVLELPFFLWYPFNPSDVRIWPFTYIHQLWSAAIAILTVIGPDNYFSMCCTFIHLQFRNFQYDIERITVQQFYRNNKTPDVTFHAQLIKIIERHRELIRCGEMLETIFTKSTLFNVATSSLLICATGFNVTTIDNYFLMAPFIGFLMSGLFQIFLFCYYGDLIMTSSTDVGTAVYNSLWYTGNAAVMKDMLVIAMRSQSPCKLTAFGFAEINLSTFCRIMGTAWSYFTLLKTVYK